MIQTTYWQVLEGRQQELFDKVDRYLAGNGAAEAHRGDGSEEKRRRKKAKKKSKKPKHEGGGQAGDSL